MIPKFRAWDKESKTMGTVRRITWTNGDITDVYLENIGLRRLDQVILMQYTGLIDVSDVEIYECDIVETPSSKAKYLVDYVEGSFIGRIKYREYTTLYKGLKVIGNIYEHPELLEVAE